MLQLCVSPLTKPEMMTNKSTSTLTEVKTLLTQADSFTPNDKSPGWSQRIKKKKWTEMLLMPSSYNLSLNTLEKSNVT